MERGREARGRRECVVVAAVVVDDGGGGAQWRLWKKVGEGGRGRREAAEIMREEVSAKV